ANAWDRFRDELLVQRRTTQLQGDAPIWIATERIPQFQAIFPNAAFDPPTIVPEEFTRIAWTRESALAEIVRGRLTGLGPVTVAMIAASLSLAPGDIDLALIALETEGYVMRGHFTPGTSEGEWCERHLLARIHRYTVNRLRREIEPVEPRDFMRFLFEWQRVAPGARVEGADAVANIVAQLEGFEAPAAAWETEILPTRLNEYDPAWLDDLSRAGRVVWTRIAPLAANGERAPSPVRTTPIVLASRRNLGLWARLARDGAEAALTSRGTQTLEFITAHGASF